MWMVTENTEWERLCTCHTHTHVKDLANTVWEQVLAGQGSALPGVGVHERGGRPPLGCPSLQDLVDFVFVVDRHLLQTLHYHATLTSHRKKTRLKCIRRKILTVGSDFSSRGKTKKIKDQ